MAIEVLIVAALAAVAAFLFATTFPKLTAYIVTGRMIIAAVVTVVFAAIIISTNVTELMIIGGMIIFLVGLDYYATDTDTAVW